MNRKRSAYIWVTWLTALLAGDDHCRYAPWVKAWHTYAKREDRDFDLATWKAEHDVMVTARHAELQAAGWTVYLETQNKFHLKGQAGTLAGAPDLVARKGSRGLVIDAKSGQRRAKDIWQVLIYLFALPLQGHAALDGAETVEGEVLYRDGTVPVPAGSVTPEVRARIVAQIKEAGGAEAPPAVPSAQECGFCLIADCAHRVEAAAPVAVGVF